MSLVHHLKTETDPIFVTLCSFGFSRIPDDGQSSKPTNPECYTPSSEPLKLTDRAVNDTAIAIKRRQMKGRRYKLDISMRNNVIILELITNNSCIIFITINNPLFQIGLQHAVR
jgi:hypothetical protein